MFHHTDVLQKRSIIDVWQIPKSTSPLDYFKRGKSHERNSRLPYSARGNLFSDLVNIWSKQRRRKHNLVTTLLRRCPTSQPKDNQNLSLSQSHVPAGPWILILLKKKKIGFSSLIFALKILASDWFKIPPIYLRSLKIPCLWQFATLNSWNIWIFNVSGHLISMTFSTFKLYLWYR